MYIERRERDYYVNIPDTPGLHPAHLLATFVTAMYTLHKKIWVECFLSRPDGEEFYLGNPVTGRLLKRFIKEFSELELVTFGESYHQRSGIDFINEHPEITCVIELGDGISALWKKKYYKNKVRLFYPSTMLVWIQYSSTDRMDEKLEQFGKNCFEESYHYQCGYDCRMEKFAHRLGDIGLTGHSYENFDQFVDVWKETLGEYEGYMPIIVFHNKELNLKFLKRKLEGSHLEFFDGAEYCPDKIYFVYLNMTWA